MLRSRKSRREEPQLPREEQGATADPEAENQLADSVGVALLAVLDTLTPAERLAFVLHEMFGVPFEEIAPIVGRSPAAARQLASRARRRVRGAPRESDTDLRAQRSVVAAFLAALRGGDMEALVAVLDPEVVVRADSTAAPPAGNEVRGARNWAKGAIVYSRGARAAIPALVDGAVGVVIAPRGKLFRVLRFTFADDKIARIDVLGDRAELADLDIAVLPD